jgi:hypothetical protein
MPIWDALPTHFDLVKLQFAPCVCVCVCVDRAAPGLGHPLHFSSEPSEVGSDQQQVVVAYGGHSVAWAPGQFLDNRVELLNLYNNMRTYVYTRDQMLWLGARVSLP